MSKAIRSEMFSETGCVPGIDGEQVPPETIVPEAKEIHLGDDRRPGSNLRSGDMGYIRVCAGPFVAGTKMESKMPQALSVVLSAAGRLRPHFE